MQEAVAEDGFLDHVVFSDESTFHLTGRLHRHNERRWGTEHSHMKGKGFPKDQCFLHSVHTKGLWAFLFCEDTAIWTSYLEMLQTWLFPKLHED
jgi:hypothetical protein